MIVALAASLVLGRYLVRLMAYMLTEGHYHAMSTQFSGVPAKSLIKNKFQPKAEGGVSALVTQTAKKSMKSMRRVYMV